MKTNEKLDFLMRLTRTTNAALGKCLTFDASYISRIRSGKRSLPRTQPFAEPAARFFAQHIQADYQKKVAAEWLCPGSDWPEDICSAQALICQWLSASPQAEHAPVGGLLTGLSRVQSTPLPPAAPPDPLPDQPEASARFFYGNEGKRQAVIAFLSELGQMDHPPQLLLYSNEEFNWMYEDPAFARQWALLLFAYIKRGGRVKIAHTISRASGEMLVALQKWIPVYLTGAIEPYYYPKILDRVFRRTLFIAEGHSAITASSVGDHTEGALNCLIRDPQAVKALETEFWSFFGLCRPLMQIFDPSGRDRFSDVLKTFHAAHENSITVRTTPSFYTMPGSVADAMARRAGDDLVLRRQEAGNRAFADLMDRGLSLTEVLNLPPEADILAGGVPFPVCDLPDRPALSYQTAEFADHLDSMIQRLRQYPNYHVVLTSAIPGNELVYVKEDMGVILMKSDAPTIAFAINEQRMVSAFWDYLSELKESGSTRASSLRQLEKLRDRLRDPS